MSFRDELRKKMDPAYHPRTETGRVSETKAERLARMEAGFEAQGGRNIALAESIDALRADIEDDAYRVVARARHEDEGTLEFDDVPMVSRSDDGGAYVQAWVWVADEDLS